EALRAVRVQVERRRGAGEGGGDQVAGGRGEADAGALVTAGVVQAGPARVRADHRDVVRAVRPEAPVRADRLYPAEEREQGDRLGGEPAQYVQAESTVEPDPLAARSY